METDQLKKKTIGKKKMIHKLHLWLGLISSIIVFIVCLTGVLLVYSDEIIDLSAGKARYVEQVFPQKLPVEILAKQAVAAVPEAKQSSYMVAYRDSERSVRFNVFSKSAGLNMVYVDQYTGKVLKVDNTIFFFYTVAHLHESLMLDEPGRWIVDISTIVFLIEIITGIVLWIPRRWNANSRKSLFTVKWNAPWKRFSFDIHRVLGMYASGILLVVVVTGVILAFKPIKNTTYHLFGGKDSHAWEESARQMFDSSTVRIPIDAAIAKAFSTCPNKNQVKIALWEYEKRPYFLLAATNRAGLKSEQNPNILYIDRLSGSINSNVPAKIRKGEEINNLVWMLHMGNWLGPIGKLLTFLGGLVGCLLPVTGFYIWWNKRPKKKKA